MTSALLLRACLMKVAHKGSARFGLISMLLGLHLPQTIAEGLAGALQRAADLKASWGDDFVSAEHLLQVMPWRAVLPITHAWLL